MVRKSISVSITIRFLASIVKSVASWNVVAIWTKYASRKYQSTIYRYGEIKSYGKFLSFVWYSSWDDM